MQKQDLEKDLESLTLSEITDKYKVTKTSIKQLIEQYGLKLKYENRTPYTKGLIPITDNKYKDKKKRQQTNEIMEADFTERGWPKREIEARQKDLKELSYQMGAVLYRLQSLEKDLNNLLHRKAQQDFMISLCKKTLKTKDYCSFIEEERYGIRPEYDKFNLNMLNDEIILGYLSSKLDMFQLQTLKELLK